MILLVSGNDVLSSYVNNMWVNDSLFEKIKAEFLIVYRFVPLDELLSELKTTQGAFEIFKVSSLSVLS